MMDIEQLKEQIKIVANLRLKLGMTVEIKKSAYDMWLKDNANVLEAEQETRELLTKQEQTLRELTLQVYAETGSKVPAPGVAVREMTRFDYDPKDALKWAMEHQIALSLDKKSFEGFAKATPLDFVKITQEPIATIAAKLEIE